jgi:hypothetical protein
MPRVQPDADKIFPSREEAERARDRLNASPPPPGYGQWYLGGPVEGKWWLLRWRGLTAEEIGEPETYEAAYRVAVERVARDEAFWREVEGIRFDAVDLCGSYPETVVVLRFRGVATERHRVYDAGCTFGYRWKIWPAQNADPAEDASDLFDNFMEFLGTNASAYRVRRGPCQSEGTNWLN